LENNTFYSNESNSESGGAVCFENMLNNTAPSAQFDTRLDELLIENNIFDENFSEGNGGALSLNNFTLIGSIANRISVNIKKNSFSNNYSRDNGGSVSLLNLENVDMSYNLNKNLNNQSIDDGGGIYMYNVLSFTCLNNLISENTSNYGNGGGIYCESQSSFSFGSNTIANNTAGQGDGGGIYFEDVYYGFYNSIIWGNYPNPFVDVTNNNPYNLFSYCDIENGSQINYNIDADPQFINGYRIDDCSPCKNVGDNQAPHTPTDLDFNYRVYEQIIDMGAYESIIKCSGGARMAQKHEEEMLTDDNYNSGITVQPNPFTDFITVRSNEKILSVSVYTANGQLVRSLKNENDTDINIPLFELKDGVYYVKIQTNSKSYTRKIIKKSS
jgi:hypothetical protein